MEISMNMNPARKEKMEENLTDWHSVGTETIAVPAGTFSCERWRNNKNNAEIWTSDKVTPFGMVKEISPNGGTQVLSRILDNASDRITGPVKQFDMQQMMQQMQHNVSKSPNPDAPPAWHRHSCLCSWFLLERQSPDWRSCGARAHLARCSRVCSGDL